jgi:Ni/Co efflux regulator RcnB
MRSLVLVLIAVIAATSAAAGQSGRGKGRNEPKARETSRVELSVSAAGFDVAMQQTIRGYYAGKPRAARMPRGVARNYARGRALPKGIAKRPVASELQAILPAQAGYEYIVVNRDVLLISVRTGIVADILIDVL